MFLHSVIFLQPETDSRKFLQPETGNRFEKKSLQPEPETGNWFRKPETGSRKKKFATGIGNRKLVPETVSRQKNFAIGTGNRNRKPVFATGNRFPETGNR